MSPAAACFSVTGRSGGRTNIRARIKAFLGVGPLAVLALAAHSAAAADASTNAIASGRDSARLEPAQPTSVWRDGLESSLRKGAEEVGLALGAGIGMDTFGSTRAHDLVLGRLHYGRVLTDVIEGQGYLRGNLEGRVEFLGGGQYHPDSSYLIALTPVLRYNFVTGSRWMPFVDAGAGVSLTDIGRPDLSTTFEFNLQAGAGLNYFLRQNLALTLQYRYLHMSNAGIEKPNRGVDANVFSTGLTWFF